MKKNFEKSQAPQKNEKVKEAQGEKQLINSANKLAEIGKKKSLGKMIKEVFKKFVEKDFTAAFASVTAIIASFYSKELANLKVGVDKTRQAKQKKEKKSEPKPDNEASQANSAKEANKASSVKPKIKLKKVNIDEFRKGDLFTSIEKTFENSQVEPRLVPLKTAVWKNRKGAPGWTKKSTDNWNHEAAGKQDVEKGIYNIEGTLAPPGYSRNVSNVPSHIKPKLTQIAVALNKDPRFPLFKGIAINVDGIDVIFVKEIHMHKRGTASTYLCQPHTGTSYGVKNETGNIS